MPGRVRAKLVHQKGRQLAQLFRVVIGPGNKQRRHLQPPAQTTHPHEIAEDRPEAPVLPLFAYGAVGFAGDRFYVAAAKVDQDKRQVFTGIPRERLVKGAEKLQRRYPGNRLVTHLMGCALQSSCPAARNLALGRFEAPLPTSRVCNARCVGCLSLQEPDTGFPSTQCRIAFTPTPEEVVEVMVKVLDETHSSYN